MIYFSDFGGAAPVSTSYSNPGGTGNRVGSITIATNQGITGSTNEWINGSFGNTMYWNTNSLFSSDYLSFDFGSAKVIDEFKWYQSGATAQGTWVFQGSNDNTNWTSLGANLNLDSGTFPITNSTAYRYYRLRGVSGSTSAGPWLQEIEFKISA